MCEEYYSTVYGFRVSITGGDFDLAEELTQETFLRAMKQAPKFRHDCKMSTWLCQIAKFTFYQYLEKHNKAKEVPLNDAIAYAASSQMEESLIDSEQKLHIFKLIQNLKSPVKDVLLLRLTGELSFREIGEILGHTENWARVTFYRGKQLIGKELQSDGKNNS